MRPFLKTHHAPAPVSDVSGFQAGLAHDLEAIRGALDAVAHNTFAATELLRRAGETHRIHQETFEAGLLSRPRYREPKRLNRFEHQVFSQNGEDGLIAEVFRRVGTKDRTFVEVGVGDGLENNTAFLLAQGWTGCWVDGNPDFMAGVRDRYARRLADGSLRAVEMFVTRENLAGALRAQGVGDEVDLLSLDIDRNTYWAWSALAGLRARAVVVEYNATFPPDLDWVIDYDPEAVWDGTTYFGASLKAFERLGRELGYRLVGCESHGVNALFVRDDLAADAFLDPADAETHYEPPRYWLVRTAGHPRGHRILA